MFIVIPSKQDVKDFPKNSRKNWKAILIGILLLITVLVWGAVFFRLLNGQGITDSGIGLKIKVQETLWDIEADQPTGQGSHLIAIKLEVKFGGVIANNTMSIYDKLALASDQGTKSKPLPTLLGDFFVAHPELPKQVPKDGTVEGWLVFENKSGGDTVELQYHRGVMASVYKAIPEYEASIKLRR